MGYIIDGCIWWEAITKQPDGVYKEYNSVLGGKDNVSLEAHFKNGKLNGTTKWFGSSGELIWEIPYVDGAKHGMVKDYQDGIVHYLFNNGEMLFKAVLK